MTGRREGFVELRKFGGMSGFPKTKESDCDCFNTGHSSTSISAGLGLVKARDLKGENNTVVAVIGDGSLTGGMAYEALNNAAKLETNYIIVLNDNNMSISENVGGMSKYLNSVRTADGYLNLRDGVYNTIMDMPNGDKVANKIRRFKNMFKQMVVPGMLFEDMGITYLGPVDGHDINAMVRTFQEARRIRKAVIVHVITEKGRGFTPAERHPARFHGTSAFNLEHGIPLKTGGKANYTDIFSTVMLKLADRVPNLVALTAAMPDGTGLKRFRNRFPQRFFDVGIAEEHAVTCAAGMALGGMIPVVAIYSSFLQRAVDQIIEDVCLQNLHVIFAIDRAGLVGSDGETHQGCFDLSYLSMIPNMTVLAPKNKWELSDMLKFAVRYQGPIAIRYPRGEAYDGLEEYREPMVYGKSELIFEGEETALLSVGSMVETAVEVREKLKADKINATLVNARFIKPLDTKILDRLAVKHKKIVTMEENVKNGGFGMAVSEYMQEYHPEVKVQIIALPDAFITHGNSKLLKAKAGIDADSIYGAIKEAEKR